MSNHTPGPWDGRLPVVRDQRGRMVADCRSSLMGDNEGGKGGETDYANARLIAAAPEMLEALKDLTDLVERVGDSRKDAPFVAAGRAAIAKAEGREP